MLNRELPRLRRLFLLIKYFDPKLTKPVCGFLKDPKDDMVLELAVTARCDFIVTYNKNDFQGVELFGLQVMTPQEFLQKIGELP